MKAASPALIAMFSTNQDFEQFDLYTITLTSGLVLRYTPCPFDVVYGGFRWLCSTSQSSVAIEEAAESGPRAHWTNDLNVGTWQVTIMPRPADVIGAKPFLWAVKAGILNEATFRVDRGYIQSWPSVPGLSIVPVGTINVFYGRIAEVDFGRSSVQINANDPRELLATDQPRNLFTAGCRDALFGPVCRLVKANFAVNGSITAIGGQQLTTTFNNPNGYFNLGEINFTSGGNAGLRMMIRYYMSDGTMLLLSPMPFDINVGDAITAYPGCDKTRTTCIGKFNNILNYDGEPFIPAAETAV